MDYFQLLQHTYIVHVCFIVVDYGHWKSVPSCYCHDRQDYIITRSTEMMEALVCDQKIFASRFRFQRQGVSSQGSNTQCYTILSTTGDYPRWWIFPWQYWVVSSQVAIHNGAFFGESIEDNPRWWISQGNTEWYQVRVAIHDGTLFGESIEDNPRWWLSHSITH